MGDAHVETSQHYSADNADAVKYFAAYLIDIPYAFPTLARANKVRICQSAGLAQMQGVSDLSGKNETQSEVRQINQAQESLERKPNAGIHFCQMFDHQRIGAECRQNAASLLIPPGQSARLSGMA